MPLVVPVPASDLRQALNAKHQKSCQIVSENEKKALKSWNLAKADQLSDGSGIES